MAESKKFNLFSYVYGRLFAEQYFEKEPIGYLFETSKKIYSWEGILYWLKKEGHLVDYHIGNVDFNMSVITYKFNRQYLTNKPYLKAIEKSLLKNSLQIEPMGDLINKKAYDEFEAQYKKPVEYITAADRCLKELNQKISEELEKATSKTSDDGEEKKAA